MAYEIRSWDESSLVTVNVCEIHWTPLPCYSCQTGSAVLPQLEITTRPLTEEDVRRVVREELRKALRAIEGEE